MSRVLYKEEQKFSTPWIFLVIIPTLQAIIFFVRYKGGYSEINISEKDDILGLAILGLIMFIMMVGLTILFYKMKLYTTIKTDGIYIKYPPMIKKIRFISKAEISNYEIKIFDGKGRQRSRMMKKKIRQTGKVYTLSGKFGLILYLTNEKKVLIDTNRKEAIKYAMDKMLKNN